MPVPVPARLRAAANFILKPTQRRSILDRRQALIGTGATLAAVATSQVFAQAAAGASQHQHHHHHGGAATSATQIKTVIESAAHCVVTGELCLDHCHDLLAEGDKAMAECAKAVNQLVAVCAALRSVAAQGGTQLKAMAKVALDTCVECEKECRKHEKHASCKDCGDACADCAKACEAVLV